MTVLPVTYLGSIEWFGYLAAGCGDTARGGCVIDIGERWVKQTARNRCEIMTSGGAAALTVPVHGGTATKDIKIDNSKRWQHVHWISLVSAYRNSPFFDHYEEKFAPVYAKEMNFLIDLDLELLNILTGILGLTGAMKISETPVTASPGDIDLRGKKALRRDKAAGKVKYTQVFSDRIPFEAGLSIVDLLFCEGPAAREWLCPRQNLSHPHR